jgi:hypothetical protein
MRRFRPPDWLRRGIEAAVIGGGVAVVSLLGTGLGRSGAESPAVALPVGASGLLLLAPAVLALGAVAVTYPVAMAATRTDALLGAFAGFLLAADAVIILAGGPVSLPRTGVVVGAGVLSALIALGPAIVGIVAGQLASTLGFGRRAGGWTAAGAVVAGLLALGVVFGMG